jgi:hypothetical protein
VTRILALGVVLLASTAFASDEEKMHFDVEHHFTKADARARAQMLFEYWRRAYGVDTQWDGDRAHVVGRVLGIDINAVLEVTDQHIGGDGDDPGPIFRGLAKSYVTKKLQKYMHPQYLEQ